MGLRADRIARQKNTGEPCVQADLVAAAAR
jgi:hypothetical protein